MNRLIVSCMSVIFFHYYVISIGNLSNLFPKGFKGSADGVNAGSFPGVGQQSSGLLHSFDLRHTPKRGVGSYPRLLSRT